VSSSIKQTLKLASNSTPKRKFAKELINVDFPVPVYPTTRIIFALALSAGVNKVFFRR